MITILIKTGLKYKPMLNTSGTSLSQLLFLRKARLFVKSRYSRNRQWSKSIVYFGLWFNIISVIWTIYYCYRYMFIFSHLYWLGALFVCLASLRFAKRISWQSLSVFLKHLTLQV